MIKTPFPTIPRLESLHHRLKTAKDPDGHPLPLLDELMVFLEDPPPGTTDRWQAGADLCAAHGIATCRASIWRFYRAHIVEWRQEQAPPDRNAEALQQSTALLLEQARHLTALRAVESLHQPHLPARVLVGLVQNENRRQELQLARDKFNDQLDTRLRLEHQQKVREIDDQARAKAMLPYQLASQGKHLETLIKIIAADQARTSPSPVSPHFKP